MQRDPDNIRKKTYMMTAGLLVIVLMMIIALVKDLRNDVPVYYESAGTEKTEPSDAAQDQENTAAGSAVSEHYIEDELWEEKLERYLADRDPAEPGINDYLGGDSAWLSEEEMEGTQLQSAAVSYKNDKVLTHTFSNGGTLTVGRDDARVTGKLYLCPEYSGGEETVSSRWGVYVNTAGGRLICSDDMSEYGGTSGAGTYVIMNHTYDTIVSAQNTAWKITSDFGDDSDTVFINNIVPEYRIRLRVVDLENRSIAAAAVCTVRYNDGAYELTKLENADIGEYAEYLELRERAVEAAIEFIGNKDMGPSFLSAADHPDTLRQSAVAEFTDALYFGYCAGTQGEFMRAGELSGRGPLIAVSAVHPTVGNITVYLMTEEQIRGVRKTEPYDDPDTDVYPVGYDFLLPETKDTIHVPGPAADEYYRYRNSTGKW